VIELAQANWTNFEEPADRVETVSIELRMRREPSELPRTRRPSMNGLVGSGVD
jgi:hypothetical protein